MQRKWSNVFIFLFILLLPTQLSKHFFPAFSYLQGIRVDYLSPAVFLTDILAIFIIILNFRILKKYRYDRKIIGVFLGLIILNILFALSPFVAVYYWLKVGMLFGVFLIFRKLKISPYHLLILFSIAASYELILAIAQVWDSSSLQGVHYFFGERLFTLDTPGIAKTTWHGAEFLRPYATFPHPNSLGGFYLLLHTFVLLDERFKLYPRLKTLLLVLSGCLILISFSKTALIGFIVIYLYWLFLHHSCLICTIAKGTFLLVLAIIVFSFHGDPESLGKRLFLFQSSLNIFFHNPVLGVGLGNYVIAQSTFTHNYSYSFFQPVHNIFLLFLTESGMFLTLGIMKKIWKIVEKNWKHEVWRGVVMVLLVTGFMDHYWLTLQQNMLLLAVVFGLITREIGTKYDKIDL